MIYCLLLWEMYFLSSITENKFIIKIKEKKTLYFSFLFLKICCFVLFSLLRESTKHLCTEPAIVSNGICSYWLLHVLICCETLLILPQYLSWPHSRKPRNTGHKKCQVVTIANKGKVERSS